MPHIVDYPIVLQTLAGIGLRSLHYNSGVFGLPANVESYSIGWITADDPTLTAAARQCAHVIDPPTAEKLAELFVHTWQRELPGPVWIMPGSHWAYELSFGGKTALENLLRSVSIEPAELKDRTAAAAVCFESDETDALSGFLVGLLNLLKQSDFAAAFPAHRTTVLIHHHVQLWWTSASKDVDLTP